MSDENPQKDFLNTPDASEYLQKLQTGRTSLPSEASALERKMFEQLQELQKKVRALSVTSGDLEKEILAAQARQRAVSRDIDLLSGEMTGYAKMLVSAEGARREETKDAVEEPQPEKVETKDAVEEPKPEKVEEPKP